MAILVLIVLAGAAAGCSTSNFDGPMSLVGPDGRHVESWLDGHGTFAIPGGDACQPCHGEDLGGGISGVTCSQDGCHHQGAVPWALPSEHGVAAKASLGFSSCAICHGVDYTGGLAGAACAGADCHAINAPHPDSWWGDAVPFRHQADPPTDPDNAPVCALCHRDGALSPLPPPSPPSTSAPGCFNNTLCHGYFHEAPFLGHEDVAPVQADFDSTCSACHAMTGTSPRAGAPACRVCHTQGSPYALAACLSCHGNPPGTGQHSDHGGAGCGACHLGAGTGSGLNHFYDAQVDVAFAAAGFSYNSTTQRCTGTCHFGGEREDHSSRQW